MIKCKFVFQKMNNTLTAFKKNSDSWFSNIDKRKIIISVFLDLKKAFDTVDHEVFLSKLPKYGIAGTHLRWFISHLTSRKQYCQVNVQKSNLRLVQSCIPQGSSLGLPLFFPYINDFYQCLIKCTSNMYSDDISVMCSAEDIDELCNDLKVEVDNIAEWLRQKKLSLKTDKTEYIVIGRKRQTNHIIRPLEVSIYKESIERAKEVNYLWITVDENLTWTEDYKKLKCRITAAISPSRKLRIY